MNILHIAQIDGNPASGVVAAAPQHIFYQAAHANVALMNLVNYKPENSEITYPVFIGNKVSSLPAPFSKPDIVVFHEIYRPKFGRISKYLKKEGVPYIIVPHGSLTRQAQGLKNIKKSIGNAIIFNEYIRSSSAIQYLSRHEMNTSKKWNSSSLLSSNGTNMLPGGKGDYDADILRIIYVGRVDIVTKGLDRLVHAVSAARNASANVKLLISIYGPGSKREVQKLERMIIENELSDCISLQPAIYGDEKIQTILEHDVFIQLSRSEGSPMGPIEAIAMGMPVIVTRGTTLYDDVNEFELGFAVDDAPESIGAQLIYIAKNKYLLKEVSERAKKYAKIKYNWDSIAANDVKKYKTIMRGSL